MKTIKQFSLILTACLALAFTGCDEKESIPENPVLNPDIISVTEGSAAAIAISGGNAPYTAQSSATAVATVSVNASTLTVTGVATGTASITVTTGDGGSARLPVVVTERSATAPVLNVQSVEVEIDETASVSILEGTAPFTVSSSNTTIATATLNGSIIAVKGIADGAALITVTGADNASSSFAVDVNGEQILFGPNKTQIGSGLKSFSIKKSHRIKKGVYTMVGWVYVEDGATLSIEPGTVIKGANTSFDGREAAEGSSLIIMRGAKIIAQGTRNEPIVFTSAQPAGQRKASDWGGIIICGKAKNNLTAMTIEGGIEADHGGTDDNDNSGILQYVRIEFGGYPYAVDNEINGLTLGSVGRGTTLDHIQVSYSGDDSFEWFGGAVNAKHLIAYHGWDDDFDTDNGFSGKLQFLLGVRDPKIADQSNTNGFESDNNASGSTSDPITSAVFSNVTLIGPLGQDAAFVNDKSYINGYGWGESSGIRTGIFQAAMQIRRHSRLNCFNSVAAGFPVGLMLSNDGRGDTQGAAAASLLKLKNVYFAGMGLLGADADKKDPAQWSGTISIDYFNRTDLNNRNFGAISDLNLKQPNSKQANANYGPSAGSPLLGNASFSDTFLTDAFFSPVTYIGAFSGENDDWASGWTNFDPQQANY
ncbi:MAG: hypothetical protein LBB85_04505 [Dysgonamonadaceae bacterium]|jgi:hypothetical protein|nr:hypothetical protein [Dysgonamonadaceae bacterium]